MEEKEEEFFYEVECIKELAKKAKELRNNFKTMGSCMIYPQNIKIGSLEKFLYSDIVTTFQVGDTSIGHIDEKYGPIEGEKVFIQLVEDRDVYFDIDEVNNIFDLYQIRKQIKDDLNIRLGGKILDCHSSSKIRINKKTLEAHPDFKNLASPISLKQLKKEIGYRRRGLGDIEC